MGRNNVQKLAHGSTTGRIVGEALIHCGQRKPSAEQASESFSLTNDVQWFGL